jgi:hypothetical protein
MNKFDKNFHINFIPLYFVVLVMLVMAFANTASAESVIKKENFYSIIALEHISSIPDGKPFNSRHETAADMIQIGIRYKQKGWKFDALIGAEVNGSFVGDNPIFILRIEKEQRLFNRGK